MTTLVLGASGATGKLVVARLLERNVPVRIVVRETAILPDTIKGNKNLEIVKANIDALDVNEIKRLIQDCDSIVCCLGHTISFKGLFGPPRRLVAHAVKKITAAITSLNTAKKLVLMSTTAYTNTLLGEKNKFAEKMIFSLLEIFLPPHRDNMLAGRHLVHGVKESTLIEWVAVRPDSLFDEENKSDYHVCESKARSPIFNPGKTSRINVSHFMVDLLCNDTLWQKWKHQTPVIYNKEWMVQANR